MAMVKRAPSPGQIDLFNPIPVMSPKPSRVRGKRKARNLLKGDQLPLPITGAEPMAIGYESTAPVFAIGDLVEMQNATAMPWHRCRVVGYHPQGSVIAQRLSDGFEMWSGPDFCRRVQDGQAHPQS